MLHAAARRDAAMTVATTMPRVAALFCTATMFRAVAMLREFWGIEKSERLTTGDWFLLKPNGKSNEYFVINFRDFANCLMENFRGD